MAERRMFSKTVTQSAKFLKMPVAARLLYYDLGMAADDDGIVEAFAVLRMTGAAEEDLDILHRKEFIEVLDPEDMIVFIRHWRRNNYIQKDRYKPSVYQFLLPGYDDDFSGGTDTGDFPY